MDSFPSCVPTSCFDTVFSLKIWLLNATRGQGYPPSPAKPPGALLSSHPGTVDPLAPNSATFTLISVFNPSVSPPFCHPELRVSPASVRSSSHPTSCFSLELSDWEQGILLQDPYPGNTQFHKATHKEAKAINLPSSLPTHTTVTQGQLQPYRVTHRHWHKTSHTSWLHRGHNRKHPTEGTSYAVTYITVSERPWVQTHMVIHKHHTYTPNLILSHTPHHGSLPLISVSLTPTLSATSQKLYLQALWWQSMVHSLSPTHFGVTHITSFPLSLSLTHILNGFCFRDTRISHTHRYTNTATAISLTHTQYTLGSPSHSDTHGLSYNLTRSHQHAFGLSHTHTRPHDLSLSASPGAPHTCWPLTLGHTRFPHTHQHALGLSHSQSGLSLSLTHTPALNTISPSQSLPGPHTCWPLTHRHIRFSHTHTNTPRSHSLCIFHSPVLSLTHTPLQPPHSPEPGSSRGLDAPARASGKCSRSGRDGAAALRPGLHGRVRAACLACPAPPRPRAWTPDHPKQPRGLPPEASHTHPKDFGADAREQSAQAPNLPGGRNKGRG